MKKVVILLILFMILNSLIGYEYLYSQSPQLVWSKEINYKILNNNDYGLKIAKDSNGNIYILCEINNSLALMKFDSSGNTIWSNHITSSFSWGLHPPIFDIAIDSSDYIYITYESSYCKTMKFDSSGNLLWSEDFGPDSFNTNYTPYGISVSTDSVYICGNNTIYSPTYNINSFLLKYDKDGNLLFSIVTNLTSTGTNDNQWYDIKAFNEYIYLTGSSDYHISVVKYSNNGKLIWYTNYENYFGEGYGIDIKKNIYITGEYNNDIFTMCISQNKNIIWTNTYNGSADISDIGYSITIDTNTNIIITGKINYNSGLTNKGNMFVRKMDKNKNVLWDNIYNNLDSNPDDSANSAIIDSHSNICIAGYIHKNNNYDIFLQKYNYTGSVLWNKTINSIRYSDDEANDSYIDKNGYIYLIGNVEVEENKYAIYVSKFDSTGNQIWAKTIKSNDNWIEGTGITLDSSGNIYITGDVYTNIFSYQNVILIGKYDNNMNKIWEKYTGSSTNDNIAGKIAIDDNNNIYITGSIESYPSVNYNILIEKYDNNGNRIWQKIYDSNPVTNSEDWGNDIAVDSSYVYVTGSIQPLNNNYIYLYKLDSNDGSEIWQRIIYNINYYNGGYAVAVDKDKNITVGGYFQDGTSISNIKRILIQYSPDGATNWLHIMENNNKPSGISSITVDEENNLYITASTNINFTGQSSHIWIAKYNSSGELQWSTSYNQFNWASPAIINLLPDKSIVLTGYNNNENNNIFILKYSEESTITPAASELSNVHIQNAISYGDSEIIIKGLTEKATIYIYNIKGELLKTIDKDSPTDEQRISFFDLNYASGVYFLYIKAGESHTLKKIVYVK